MPWLAVEQFEYERVQERAVLQLLATLNDELTVPAGATLAVRRPGARAIHEPYASTTSSCHESARDGQSPSGLLWRASFSVSLDIVEYPHAVFLLFADGRLPVALPAPLLLSADLSDAAQPLRLGGARVRRHLVALAAGVAVAASGSGIGVASAATMNLGVSHPPAPGKAVVLRTPAPTRPAGTAAQKVRPKANGTRTTNTAGAAKRPSPSGQQPSSASTGKHHASSTLQCTLPLQPTTLAAGSGVVNCLSPAAADSLARHHGHHRHRHHHHPGHHSSQTNAPRTHNEGTRHDQTTSGLPHDHARPRHGTAHHAHHAHTSPSGGAAPVVTPPLPIITPAPPAPSPFTSPSPAGTASPWWPGGPNVPTAAAALSQIISQLPTGDQPPGFLIPIYQAAAERYHVPWQILAAINWIETDYGRNLNVSPAGAVGWMQFMPTTWQQYGVAADGQGQPNPDSPLDAIFSAARYLAANGAAQNLPKAIYAYNHAGWYVAEVMWRAQIISDHAYTRTSASVAGGLNLDPATIAALSRAAALRPTGDQPPAFMIPIYKAAGTLYHVPWRILAAMNWIETNYGANLNTSSAGSMGWMQFTPEMWHEYGVAADGHGKPNPYSPLDAIFSAAHYLAANGAMKDLPRAIYGYDQATFYVVDVMRRAGIIRDDTHASADTALAGTGHIGLTAAESMLVAAYSAVGGPYSQANHDSFGRTAADLRRLGTDCSGFVSWVLDQVDPGFGNQTTVTLPDQRGIQLGVGQYVTMWDRPLPGDLGHVIINILGTWFESGGNTTFNPAGGIAPMSETQAVGELTGGGFLPYHLTRL
jgi:membrane-bound lytic murein transglycosylase B